MTLELILRPVEDELYTPLTRTWMDRQIMPLPGRYFGIGRTVILEDGEDGLPSEYPNAPHEIWSQDPATGQIDFIPADRAEPQIVEQTALAALALGWDSTLQNAVLNAFRRRNAASPGWNHTDWRMLLMRDALLLFPADPIPDSLTLACRFDPDCPPQTVFEETLLAVIPGNLSAHRRCYCFSTIQAFAAAWFAPDIAGASAHVPALAQTRIRVLG